jgi:hypothetical protein
MEAASFSPPLDDIRHRLGSKPHPRDIVRIITRVHRLLSQVKSKLLGKETCGRDRRPPPPPKQWVLRIQLWDTIHLERPCLR